MTASTRPVHILGGGALGTLWAAHHGPSATLLLRAGSPALRARCHLVRVHRDWADERIETHVSVEPSSGPGSPIDTLVVATKAYSVGAALDGVRHRLAPDATVVLMCNGALSLADTLRLPQDTRCLAATTTHGAWLHAPQEGGGARVQHAGCGSTWVGPLRDADPSCDSQQSAALFASSGLGALVETAAETQRRLWLKLAANAVLNPLTALWDVQNGKVLQRAEGRQLAERVCREIAEVAQRSTAEETPRAAELLAFVASCAEATALNWSSMHQDVAAGRPTEVEHLNGWVAARALALGTPGSTNVELAARVLDLSHRARAGPVV
jgi:2-dehydropantoate 2-reductase